MELQLHTCDSTATCTANCLPYCTYMYVTVPVTESGDTALGLAVREGMIGVIDYLVTKCSVDVEGE